MTKATAYTILYYDFMAEMFTCVSGLSTYKGAYVCQKMEDATIPKC